MSDILASLGKIPPAAAVGGLGLAYDAFKGNQQPQGYGQLLGEAQGLQGQGQSLMKSATGGPLPAGAQAGLNQSAQAQQARIRQEYASMGLQGSTMEAQAMNGVSQQQQAAQFQMQQSMLVDGFKMTEISSELYMGLMRENVAQDTDFAKAVAGFAAAMAGAH